MATKISVKTTFEPAKTIEPIYTGGAISADAEGKLWAATVDEDVLISENGKPLARLDGDGEPITSLCLSPLGSHLAICSRSLSMRIFGLDRMLSGHIIKASVLRNLKPHNTPVVTSSIDQSGTLLATGSADGEIKIWDLRGGFVTHAFHGHGGLVSALHFFRQDAVINSQQHEKSRNRRKRKSMELADDEMQDQVAYAAIFLASGGEDGKIRIWSLITRKCIATLDSHVSVVRDLSYCQTTHTLLSASRDKTMILWDTTGWKPSQVIPAFEVLESASFLDEGQYCYSGGEKGVVRLWNTKTGKEVTKPQKTGLENDAIVALFFSAGGASMTSVHQDQSLRLLSVPSLEELSSTAAVEPLRIIQRLSGNHDEIIDLACVGPDRSLLALATNSESVRLVTIHEDKGPDSDTRGTKPTDSFGCDMALLEGHDDIVICLDVDWSGHWLATGAKDNSAKLWSIDPSTSTFSCFATFTGHAESIGAVALPRKPPMGMDSKRSLQHPPSFLLTGSQDRTIKRWDTSKMTVSSSQTEPHTNAKALYTRVAHEKDINAIDISSDGSLFASASQDRMIKIWSLEDGSVTGILRGHKRGVWSIRFAPEDIPPISVGGTSSSRGYLVSGSGDRSVKVWSLSTYTCLLTFEGHGNSVLKVVWLPPPRPSDSAGDPSQARTIKPPQSRIVSASSDTLIKIWSPYAPSDSDHLLTTLDNHTDRVWALTTQAYSEYPLISGAADAKVTFWKDTTTQTMLEATKKVSQRIEQDQELQNHIFKREYRSVITLALQLNHPGRLLQVFEDIVSLPDSEREVDSIMGIKDIDDVIASLSHDQLYLLLQRVRDWNTNARTAMVAQRVLYCVLKRYPKGTFESMSRDRRLGRKGVKELLRALEVYTERHYKRLEELTDESWVVEYTLREMGEVSGVVAGRNGVGNGDTEMV